MPDLRIRKLLIGLGLLGLLLACAGLVQVTQAGRPGDWVPARWLLAGAWLILTPLFVYLMSLRARARRATRRRVQARQQALDAQRAALRTPEGVRAAGDAPPPAGPVT